MKVPRHTAMSVHHFFAISSGSFASVQALLLSFALRLQALDVGDARGPGAVFGVALVRAASPNCSTRGPAIMSLAARLAAQASGSWAPSRRYTGMCSRGASASAHVPPVIVCPVRGSVQVAPAGR